MKIKSPAAINTFGLLGTALMRGLMNTLDCRWALYDRSCDTAMDVPGRRSVLLVESRTQGPPVGQSLFHFRLALGGVETLPAEGVPFSVTQVTLEEFRDVVLKDYDVVAIGGYALGSPPMCWAIMLATPTPRWGAAGSPSFTPQFGTAIGLLE